MFAFLWPIGLAVLSNAIYHICARSVPETMNPFASLTITYTVGAVFSLGLYLLLNRDGSLLREYAKVNWAPFVLGLAVVGLEVGFLYAYKAGWNVSTCQIVQSSVLGVILIALGFLLYKEALTWNKIAGILICLVGLGLMNL